MHFPQVFNDEEFIAKVAKGEIGKFEEEETGKNLVLIYRKILGGDLLAV